ncbi:hypothetical protein [Vulcanisaeta souniana]|uniref:Uncharacterized protein n=2 Tax=Vulcanisaeta souniana JCM 11219 TaxID=1293586 RepID=A0ABN6SRT4_9CREN|nr:hypothetical protein [Vulcanisaeta souniana]BDR92556.1 hypothetical protein Vsou_16490 [Vulcanisaeta souniana JCM 11219]
MSLVRIGIVLVIIGASMMLIANIFMPRVYNVMVSTLDNITINLDVYSKYLIPIHLSNPAYIVVVLNNSYPLPVYVFDELGHSLTPLSYRQERGVYLLAYPLLNHGNYSLVLFNDYPEPINVSLSITELSQYLINNALVINLIMDFGAVMFLFGIALILMKVLYAARFRVISDTKA